MHDPRRYLDGIARKIDTEHNIRNNASILNYLRQSHLSL